MNEIHVGDRVVNSDPAVVGEVLPTSTTSNGLHRAADLDLHDAGDGPSFADSGLLPVRWHAPGGTYEWWEDPEFLTVVRPADDAEHAVHSASPGRSSGCCRTRSR